MLPISGFPISINLLKAPSVVANDWQILEDLTSIVVEAAYLGTRS
jgi:hypothetical protein